MKTREGAVALLFALAALCLVAVAHAGGTECYEYSGIAPWNAELTFGPASSPGAICGAMSAAYIAAGSSDSISRSGSASPAGTPGNYTCEGEFTDTYTIECPGGCPDPTPSFVSWGVSASLVPCGDTLDCEDLAGSERIVGGNVPLGSGCLAGCQVSSGLAPMIVTATGASTGLRMATITGNACSSTDNPQTEGSCVSGPFGRVCAGKKDGQNCGTFNGQRVCVESLQSGCQSFEGGGMACVVEGPGATENVPNNGTSGTPATPDMEIEKGEKTIAYYSSSTVSNSTNEIQSDDGGGDEGDGEGDDDTDPSACEGGECNVTMPGELEELQGVEAATAAFVARVDAAPIMGAVRGVSTAIPTGSCSFESFELFGATMSFTVICDLLATMLPLLSAGFLFGCGLFGMRVILSA